MASDWPRTFFTARLFLFSLDITGFFHWPTAKVTYLVVKIIDFLHQMCCVANTTQIQIHFIREFADLTISERRFTEKIQKVI